MLPTLRVGTHDGMLSVPPTRSVEQRILTQSVGTIMKFQGALPHAIAAMRNLTAQS